MVEIEINRSPDECKSYNELLPGEYYICISEGTFFFGWILRAIQFDSVYGVWICNQNGDNQDRAVLASLTSDKNELHFRKIDAKIIFKV